MSDHNTVLVLGATGGIGGEVARQMRAQGWKVHAMHRGAKPAVNEADGIIWTEGDAMNAADVIAAAQGCSVIVHAVNPPGYRRWAELVLPMLDNTIAAAHSTGATIVLPGTVYNFGTDALPVLTEASPQHPVTKKGAIRVEMERRLLTASKSGARVLIVRAGDFFGPKSGNSWFAQALVKPGRPVTVIRYPGRRGVGHQWSYLPDVARSMLELLGRRVSLAPFAVYHTAGHWDADGSQIVAAIRRVVARKTGRDPKVAALPWWLMTLASPFVTTLREMREMRYLWVEPVRLDNARLVAELGYEPHTPLDEAVEATLRGLGCFAEN